MLRAFTESLLLQRDRWILWAPVPLAFGIGTYFSLTFEPPGWWGAAALAVLVAMVLPFVRRKAAVLLWLPFLLFVLGFSAAQVRAWRVETPLLKKKTYPALMVQGRVVRAEMMDKSFRVTLDELSFPEAPPPQARMPRRVRVSLKKNDTAHPREGDVVRVKASLQPLPVPVLPGAFDFARKAYFEGIGATGYAFSPLETVEAEPRGFFFERLRGAIRDRVLSAGLAPPNIEGLMAAFMVGDTGKISPEDWDTARESGIAHLIAISGSHFAMIVGAVFFILRALLAAVPHVALHWPVKKIAAVAGICAAVFYVLLIGAPVSAQRAAVMSCLVMTAILLDRDPFTLRLAAFAACCLLLAAPEVLVGAGFQMSFAAVVGLMAFFESTRGLWRDAYEDAGFLRRAGLFLLMVLSTTVVASLAVMPFSFFHFLRDSVLAGLLANMVAVPVSSLVTFPLAFLAGVLMPFGLEAYPLMLAEKSIALFMRVAEVIVSWKMPGVVADAWPVGWLVVITLGCLWICVWQGRVRWLGLLPVVAALAFVAVRERPDALAGGRFTLLAAVRAGDGALWMSPGRKEGFARKVWEEREGGLGLRMWPEEGGGAGDALACAARDCTFTRGGRRLRFVKDGTAASAVDCGAADIVVTPEAEKPDFPCAARVVDKWQLYRKGAHLFYFGEDGIRVRTVADGRGDRPWVWPKAERYKKSSAASQ